VTGQSGAEDAATDLARTAEHAVTYARPATERVPGAVRDAAKRFRSANGFPVPQLPSAAELVRPRRNQPPNPPRSGDDDEDFSQARIMIRGD
jgi:hypothetical protein